ncbi:MAG: VOC family protein [Candidatus Rokuibacteriota bacterium]
MPPVRFDHIAMAVARIADTPGFLVGVLGGTPRYGGPSGAYTFGQWRFANRGCLEVLEPRGADGFLRRFLGSRGPGIHHVTFIVPSLEAACARAGEQGYEIVGRDERDPYWKEAFLHPKRALGIVVQMVETARRPDPPPRWQPPPGPASAPPAASVLGLTMRVRSRERALAQWRDVLLAEIEEREGALIFRWPPSPMRLVVEIDPLADEGPLAIDLAADRPVALPSGPQPVLGATFAQRKEP